MTQIERVVETTATTASDRTYATRSFTDDEIAAGKHRAFIGGHWDTHGLHQINFLIEQGLRPQHRLLDVGCGCLRAGRHLIDELNPGNYYGIDANHDLLVIGYDRELSDVQRERLPAANLRCTDRFACDFGVKFDFAIAQSVWTHVSLNYIRLNLYRLARVMEPGGRFFATFFEQPPGTAIDELRPRGKKQYTERNPFWYFRNDLRWASECAPWQFRYIGNWGHPSGQLMAEFTRLPDRSAPAPATGTSAKVKKFIRRGRGWAARRIAPS